VNVQRESNNYGTELENAYAYAYGLGLTTQYPIDNANLYGTVSEKDLATMMNTWAKKVVGIGIDTYDFTSSQPATRAVFGTLLARALRGSKYDGGVPYYSAPLNALKNAGIMTQPTNAETTQETKGYIFITLQRTEETMMGNKGSCEDPLVMLACASGKNECPAECKNQNNICADMEIERACLANESNCPEQCYPSL
jgi:hypothetical protein